MQIHSWTSVLLIILLVSLCAGCWSRRELNQIAIVVGAAIDQDDDPDRILLTTQIVLPSNIRGGGSQQQGGGGDGAGQRFAWVAEASGYTIDEAIGNFTFKVPRELYWAHNRVLIIGRQVAERGIDRLLDRFYRDPENRRIVWIVTAEGEGKELLETTSDLARVSAFGIDQLLQTIDVGSRAAAVDLQEFLKRLLSKTTAPIASHVRVVKEGKARKAEVSGTSVFQGDKLVGVLDTRQGRGLQWVLGEVNRGTIVVRCPAERSRRVSIQVVRAESKLVAEVRSGRPHVTVQVEAEGDLSGHSCGKGISNQGAFASLQKQQAMVIYNEIRDAVERAKELNADVFGFGEALRRRFPKRWKEWEADWARIFPNLSVDIEVKSSLRRIGLIADSVAAR